MVNTGSCDADHLLAKHRFVHKSKVPTSARGEILMLKQVPFVKVPLTKPNHMDNPYWRGVKVYMANFVICYTFKIPSEIGTILLSTQVTSQVQKGLLISSRTWRCSVWQGWECIECRLTLESDSYTLCFAGFVGDTSNRYIPASWTSQPIVRSWCFILRALERYWSLVIRRLTWSAS